MLKTEYMAIV